MWSEYSYHYFLDHRWKRRVWNLDLKKPLSLWLHLHGAYFILCTGSDVLMSIYLQEEPHI